MSFFDNARIVLYRINQKGLEVFLLKPKAIGDEKWSIPEAVLKYQNKPSDDKYIELDPVENERGELQKMVAMEADWHDIPSIRAMLKEDVRIIKHTLKENLPLDQGSYVVVKEAVKKVLPHDYRAIKELKDILFDRNQSKYI